MSIYIKDGDSAGPNKFKNTCVLDSILAVLHIATIGFQDKANLFNGNIFFENIISLLDQRKFYEARRDCVEELRLGTFDLCSNVEVYIPLFHKLVGRKPSGLPQDCQISRKLKGFGSVSALGDPSNPPLILVHHGSKMEPPPHVTDDETKRTFFRIFLLIGKDAHMTMCFLSGEESWLLYDNDANKPPFQDFDIRRLKDYGIYLAGYINVTQPQKDKLSVQETGKEAGLSNMWVKPFQQPTPEIGEDTGTRPFISQRNVINKVNDVEMSEQKPDDVEMQSCSSSDSDNGGSSPMLYYIKLLKVFRPHPPAEVML